MREFRAYANIMSIHIGYIPDVPFIVWARRTPSKEDIEEAWRRRYDGQGWTLVAVNHWEVR